MPSISGRLVFNSDSASSRMNIENNAIAGGPAASAADTASALPRAVPGAALLDTLPGGISPSPAVTLAAAVTEPRAFEAADNADLRVTKTSDKTNYLPGETITYSIIITNNGPATAMAPVVTDTLPAALRTPEYTNTGSGAPIWAPWPGSISLPDIAPNSKVFVTIRGRISHLATGSL
ncbi:MAG: DUF11 domain-containing protein, partial [Clostridiales bacterium]|nr:DUF11 domain-containing protein [Clostridiales bacterium]